MTEALSTVRHDYIRYANCWEDADVLLEGLQVSAGDRVLSIGSAGDNSFSLLTQHPEIVVAVDINPMQLQLIELKKAAFKALEYEDFLAFLGFTESTQRKALFAQVAHHLSSDSLNFWKARPNEIDAGLIAQGKFERYFELFRNRLLPLIHTSKGITELFEEKSAQEQAAFFQKRWNNLRWRMLFRVFFSKFVMGRFGRDPEFLKEVEIPVSEFIAKKSSQHLSDVACQHNYFLQFILRGKFMTALPHYARKEHFETIRANIDRLTVFEGLAESAFEQFSGFNRFNLSNIFEYMNPELFTAVVNNLVQHGTPGSRYAYWNLMVPRKMSNVHTDLEHDTRLSKDLTDRDKGFFYANVNFDSLP